MSDDRITEFILRLRNEADTSDFSALAHEAVPQAARAGFIGRLRTRAAAAVAVGVGTGGASERIAEAIVLVQQGATGHGLEHAAGIVPDEAGAGAALLTAAETVGPNVVTAEVQDEVN